MEVQGKPFYGSGASTFWCSNEPSLGSGLYVHGNLEVVLLLANEGLVRVAEVESLVGVHTELGTRTMKEKSREVN